MTLGAAHWLKKTFPSVRITWVAGEKIVPLLQSAGIVDHLVPVNEEGLFGNSRFNAMKAILGVWKGVSGNRYDLAVLGHRDRRYRILVLPAKCREIRMFGKMNGRAIPVSGRYHGDEYQRLFSGVDDHAMGPFSFPHVTIPKLDPVLEGLLCSENKPRVLLFPGSAKNDLREDPLRRWPITHYVELANRLSAKEYRVILSGDRSDIWVREYFKDSSVVDLIGKTDLPNLMALITRCDVVVAHDSGPLHLTLLLQKPLLAFFGPTDPKERLPRHNPSPLVSIWKGEDLPCAPCYDGLVYASCNQNLCLEKISPKEAEEAIEHLLLAQGKS
ncbi:MAG: glycosyltransferase family 9 protein [Leptospirillum sp.]